ncbi:hypothetical protein HV87_19390 [Pseudomonas aeruginosa]|nr:hypothetical protein HV87_19390 [Pseudomonas aeruginosa]QDR68333.1 hypothetical protein FPB55_12025 [Pseudomonas sp. BJP69]
MPVPMRPYTHYCSSCSWSHTVIPLSDVLFPGDWLDQCPTCGAAPLQLRAATPVELLAARLKQLLKYRR